MAIWNEVCLERNWPQKWLYRFESPAYRFARDVRRAFESVCVEESDTFDLNAFKRTYSE